MVLGFRAVHVVRSKRVVAGTALPRAIWIEGERIARVTAWDDVPAGAPLVDHGDAVIMAGVVDSHVHVNEPGRTTWEGFFTATRAAAAGGVTTIVDMPLNSIPATTSVRALEEKAAALEGKCAIDVGLWGGAVPGNDAELAPLLRAGALGFKCFLVDSGVPEFGHLGERDLARAMDVLASHDAPLLVHAELPGPLERAKQALPMDCRSYLRYVASRPPEAEIEAIALLVRECARTKARTHVVHLSAAGALGIVARAKAESLPFTAETTPHYLRLEAESVPDGATAFKCAPPIRDHENREALWKGLRDGAIDLVVTDHSPCTPELKKLDLGDFDQAWGGIASLQFGLQIVWTEAKKRGVSIEDVVCWMCEAPAKLAGLSKKGRIEEGRDADFVVWRPEADFTVTNECILHRNKVTPYEGQTLSGVIDATYLRGVKVDPKAERARGRWLKK
jgi:allantoinase